LAEDARVVANSYGGYLLLQALSLSEPYPGKLLLLSPIVGEFSSEQIRMGFIPPYAKRLYELASKGLFPAPRHCEIHVGSEDWQSIPDNVTAFATFVNAQVTVFRCRTWTTERICFSRSRPLALNNWGQNNWGQININFL
jgi:hypothetical protein